jgi:4-aminobutyrate aminotransferase-like enzyme
MSIEALVNLLYFAGGGLIGVLLHILAQVAAKRAQAESQKENARLLAEAKQTEERLTAESRRVEERLTAEIQNLREGLLTAIEGQEEEQSMTVDRDAADRLTAITLEPAGVTWRAITPIAISATDQARLTERAERAEVRKDEE